MQNRADQRFASTTNLNPGQNLNGNSYGYMAPNGPYQQYNLNAAAYGSSIGAATPQDHMDSLAQAFGSTTIHGVGSSGSAKLGTKAMLTSIPNMNATGPFPVNSQYCYPLGDGSGRVVVSGVNTTQGNYQPGIRTYPYNPTPLQYLCQGNYSGNPTLPQASQGQNWALAQAQYANPLPELAEHRRTSWSSNEETAGPSTPFFGSHTQACHPNVAISGQSPALYSTPSSNGASPIGPGPQYQQLTKTHNGQYMYTDLDELCARTPAIPRGIPAIFSGDKAQGTLETSLVNGFNTTNVYIRGLHPDTTDEMLHKYGERFGEIVSAKSMLDQQTGLCKGLGFIKFHNFVDGENCIRGFFHLGYEAKWARESQNARLKTLGDPENTNLYVSNLPISMNEAELAAIFEGIPIMSKKILRDDNGISRGVGFARFETPEICNKVIENFSGKLIGEEESALQIRYADTKDQKDLKAKTSSRRQFKTHEYQIATYSPGSPYQYTSPIATAYQSPLQSRLPSTNGIWANRASVSPALIDYTRIGSVYPAQSMYNMTGPKTFSENAAPARSRFSSRIPIQSPHTTTESNYGGVKLDCEDDGAACKVDATTPIVKSKKASPSKSQS